MKTITKLWILVSILALLAPLGLVIPEHFKAGAAWGEWGIEEVKGLVGYIPAGLAKVATLWNSPVPDYAFKGWEDKPLSALSAAYVISAMLGIAVTIGVIFLLGKFLSKKD